MTAPTPAQNPAHLFSRARSGVGTLRPCAPTVAPFAPPTVYRCPCGAAVTLDTEAPLPAGWVAVVDAHGRGKAERVGYRCGGCGAA